MKKIIFALSFFLAINANADMIKPATLDIVCTGENSAQEIKITSNAFGSEVALDGMIYVRGQLSAGTEGGGPYLQAVDSKGGYNITISGGDFETAFYEGKSIKDGSARASVNLFNKGESYKADCVGEFTFE